MAIINSELFVYQGVMGLHGIQKQVNTVKCVCHRDIMTCVGDMALMVLNQEYDT